MFEWGCPCHIVFRKQRNGKLLRFDSLWIVLPSVDPSVGREMNRTFAETLYQDLEQVTLVAMDIGDVDSSLTTKVLRDTLKSAACSAMFECREGFGNHPLTLDSMVFPDRVTAIANK